MGHNFDLGLLVLDCLLVKMSLVIASERVHAQDKHAEPCESIRGQLMDLQVEALQNLAHKIFAGKP